MKNGDALDPSELRGAELTPEERERLDRMRAESDARVLLLDERLLAGSPELRGAWLKAARRRIVSDERRLGVESGATRDHTRTVYMLQGAAALLVCLLWADRSWCGLVVWMLTFGVDWGRRCLRKEER